jgi:probable phosphoglycerate mutase
MSIILVRHGETALNLARVLQPADTPLSQTGVEQARALAGRIAAMGIGGILSSDLPRALATAQAIGAATGLPVQTTELLRERNFGDWRGQPYDGFGFDVMTMDTAPPGGESIADFEQRVASAFDRVRQLRATMAAPLVVVSHGLVIRALLANHCRPGEPAPPRLGNTALNIIEADSPHAVTLLACTAHLDARLADEQGSLSGG